MKEEKKHIVPVKLKISREQRAEMKKQKPITIWLTGLSGAGKSTLANLLEARLVENQKHTMILDGDNVRMGLNQNLGFSVEDRKENIRRVAEVAKLMNDAGLMVVVSAISPLEECRNLAREIIGAENFVEVYVATSLEECKRRDIKGLYLKAMNNEITNFTGVQCQYEIPQNPDITIDTQGKALEESIKELWDKLSKWI